MADFLHNGWSLFIAGVTLLGILACGLLLYSQSKVKVKVGADGQPLPVQTTGHVWDEDLVENNNPLPRWWMIMFYLTIVFALGYLILYPGLGSMQGTLGWSQVGKYAQEMKAGEEKYGPIFNKYQAMPIPALAQDPQAREIGERLFLNSCAQCHGSDAQGSKGFPNLADTDWLYGGAPETVLASIREGRHGQMPSMAAAVGGDQDVRNVANYVLSLSGSSHDPIKAVMGKAKYAACAACHGADGKGNQVLGAPNLTDKTWLYGGGLNNVMDAINKGRGNMMPAHKGILSDAKVHLLAAYVWGLSNRQATVAGISAGDARAMGKLTGVSDTPARQ
ncbi:cytochrome-c oxidase, cbb3-type subunit III [Noviherbaspirillum sedimenti]|uniref:Cbb3-type cytochrome c oxidase subunit n=1 Tax=Noviherbaspirillum sedimenti TaxID=2320865 RepID=A0A3A3G4W2_9BURK|nr:cytochrome-c oxidase, cbb3-type subunit III [Noviherbaspirillum sedimenti]RJG01532.1 cytochrome-c oxidase, cbb3-type subunit III [Noviherbaspirillum sedimenti]